MSFARRLATLLAVVGAMMLVPATASAHPLGNFTVNRYAGIVLAPGEVRIDYVVDMAEIPTVQVRPQVDADGDELVVALDLRQAERCRTSVPR